MIFEIAKKEFYINLNSARFAVCFLLCLFVVPLTLVVSINDYRGKVSAYETDLKTAGEALKVRVYSNLRPLVVKPPEPLSIFSRGISYNVGGRVKIWLGDKPVTPEGRALVRDNPFLNSLFSLDFVSMLAIVLSLFALLFTYDSLSGEREQRTLKMVLVNPVGRSRVLLGKVTGACLTFLPILIFCYLLSALIILISPHISLSLSDWARVMVVFVVSLIYFGLFMLIGLFISTRFQSSIASIVVCLFAWVFFLFIVPNLAVYAARSFVKVTAAENLEPALRELNKEFDDKCLEYRKSLGPADWNMNWNFSGGNDGYREMAGSSRSVMEQMREFNQFTEPLRIEYADRKWAIQAARLSELDRQRRVSEAISLFSPAGTFQLIASALCRTDAGSHYRFMDRARQYREEFIDYFEGKQIFSSWEYFTRQPPESFMTADEIVRTRTGGQFKTLEEYGKWAQANNGSFAPLWKVDIAGTSNSDYENLVLTDLPEFQMVPADLATDLKSSLAKTGVMVGLGILLFFLSFVSFIRYDVR